MFTMEDEFIEKIKILTIENEALKIQLEESEDVLNFLIMNGGETIA